MTDRSLTIQRVKGKGVCSVHDMWSVLMCECHAHNTHRWMALQLKAVAEKHCGGRLLATHEGGYSEVSECVCQSVVDP